MSTAPAAGAAVPTRLDTLLNLRARLDQEIERERNAERRIEKVRRDALAIITRGNWNQRVLLAACNRFGVDTDALLAGDRHRATMDARHVFMWLMRTSGLSFPDVGRELGMDHSSAINGYRRVENSDRLKAAAAEIHLALTGEAVA